MATTARPISELALGIRTTAGAVAASGKARWYSPGTLTPAVAYTDDACTTPASAPVTLNAGGQTTLYALEPIRLICKDSTETTTFYDGIVNLNRADSVYLTVAGLNGGAETTLETVLGTIGTSFGSGFQYKESVSATARDFTSVIRNIAIQAADFGVVADGATDDTAAMAAAIARVAALGGGRVLLPTGTILISAALTISTAGVSIEGNGRGISILKQSSTTANAINVTLASGDSKLFLKGFSITASTTSSGVGINCTVGNYVVIEDVGVGLFRTSFDVSAITGGDIRHCFVDSTDGNAAVIGINLGSSGRAWHCELASATDAGIGIKFASTDARADDCYTTNFATGFSLASARSIADKCYALSATTGFLVGAVASAQVLRCSGSSNTSDLTVNASATLFQELGNTFATITNAGASNFIVPMRSRINSGTSALITATFTPDITNGQIFQQFIASYAAGAMTLTIAAHANPSLLTIGDIMFLSVIKIGANGSSITWNAQYLGGIGSSTPSATGPGQNQMNHYIFRWDGTNWTVMSMSVQQTL